MAVGYVGEIRLFGGTFAPVGWAMCDGSLLDIGNWQALYSLIGTTYGGNGTTNFGVPDLRGRAVIAQGQGPGLSNYVMGQPLGVETVTVMTAQMPAHPHSVSATNTAGTTPAPSPSVILASPGTGFDIYDGTATPGTLAPQVVSNTGGNLPHQNRQPYQAITYIICLEGIYPSQN